MRKTDPAGKHDNIKSDKWCSCRRKIARSFSHIHSSTVQNVHIWAKAFIWPRKRIMFALTLLLIFSLIGILGLLRHRREHLNLFILFPIQLLFSEIQSFRIQNWRNLFIGKGSSHKFLWKTYSAGPNIKLITGAIPISDLSLCQKILNHPAWPNRVKSNSIFHILSFGKPLGLVYGCGEEYRRAKRTTIRTLHRMGFYKVAQLEQFVAPQVSALLRTLRDVCYQQRSDSCGSEKEAIWCRTRKLNSFVFTVAWTVLLGGCSLIT